MYEFELRTVVNPKLPASTYLVRNAKNLEEAQGRLAAHLGIPIAKVEVEYNFHAKNPAHFEPYKAFHQKIISI